jgi:hypothetical protein
MLFKDLAQMHFAFMDLSITSWGVLYLQKAFSLHMHNSTFMTLKK